MKINKFLFGFLISFLPLAILVLPLFFHQSDHFDIGTYDLQYFNFLLSMCGLAFMIAVLIGMGCDVAKSPTPLFYFWLILAGLVVIFLCAEVALSIKNNNNFVYFERWGHKKSIFYGFEARPDHRWDAAGARYTTDEAGFRSHPQDMQWRDKRHFRIFVLGGSSTFGYGLNDHETWAFNLEENLKSILGVDAADVINAGNNGHTSFQTLLRLYLKVLPCHPDMVLYYQNFNDLSDTKRDLGMVTIAPEAVLTKTVGEFWAEVNKGRNIYVRTLVFRFLQRAFGDQSSGEIISGWEMQKIQRHNGMKFITNVRTIVQLCQNNDVVPVLLTFLYDDKEVSVPEFVCYQNQLLRELSSQGDVLLIDLEKIFAPIPNKDEYFFDDGYHPNQKGSKFIADVLAHELRKFSGFENKVY